MASLPVVMDFVVDNIAEGKLQGFLAFDPGSAFVGLLVGCVFVFIIDNKWLNAAITNVVALALTGIGMIHSPGLLFTDTYSPDLGFVAAYSVLIVAFLVLHFIKISITSLFEKSVRKKKKEWKWLNLWKMPSRRSNLCSGCRRSTGGGSNGENC